jgi:hypothetical protein
MRRDVKGMYKKAIKGEIKEFTGISDPYEEPEKPEILLETDKETLDESVGIVLKRLEELGYSYDEQASLVTLHGVKNMTDFPLRVTAVNLGFRLANQPEVYKSLACRPEVTIPPGEAKDVQAQLVMKDRLLAEYRSVYPTAPPPKKIFLPVIWVEVLGAGRWWTAEI